MKVIHVLNHFLPQQVAGTEVYVWALCKHLQQKGIAVKVCIPNYGNAQNDKYEHDGIEVIRFAETSVADRALITGLRIPEGVSVLKGILKDEAPDIVHFHEIAGSNGIGVWHFEAAKSVGCKVVFTMHLATASCNTGNLMYLQKDICDGRIDIGKCTHCSLQKRLNSKWQSAVVTGLSKPLYRPLNLNLLRLNNPAGTLLSFPFQIQNLRDRLKRIEMACDALVPITHWYHKILLKNGIAPEKTHVILQGLPTEPGNVSGENRKPALPVKLIFIGRIDELKGISILIKAVQSFSEKELAVDIYGNAPNSSFLDECKNRTANNKNIRWMGRIGQESVIKTMQQYHALVLPSVFSEMSPLVIQEAFAAKLPVIGSNVYGIAELISNGENGYIFEMGDAIALRNLLSGIVNNPGSLNFGAKYKTAANSFTSVANEYIHLYKGLMN